ncbi:MAG: hypothetical protein ACTSVE_01615 [Candidatus Helarchaeota archaeon]
MNEALPVKEELSLWTFTDRLTGYVSLAVNLKFTPASKLAGLFRRIESFYGVPIVAVIPDKQKNIVNAIKTYDSNIPHVYCQYHFLKHVVEPIASKDSHLKTQPKKAVKELSIMSIASLSIKRPILTFLPYLRRT